MNSMTPVFRFPNHGGGGLALAALLLSVTPLASAAMNAAPPAGHYEIWEDFEGGAVCQLLLEDAVSIGGFALAGDNDCMAAFKFSDDPHAWFLDDQDRLAIIDATRNVLVRFERLADGSFYARRNAEGLENLNLTPKEP